jgi:hypothetical protein
MILWLSRGEQQCLLAFGLFDSELRVNLVEHAVYITEAPKPMYRFYHVFFLRPGRHRNLCASMNNPWIITVMGGYHGEELLPSQSINTFDWGKIFGRIYCRNF